MSFEQRLQNIRKDLSDLRSSSGDVLPDTSSNLGPPFPSYALESDIAKILMDMRAAVQMDVNRYKPIDTPKNPKEAETTKAMATGVSQGSQQLSALPPAAAAPTAPVKPGPMGNPLLIASFTSDFNPNLPTGIDAALAASMTMQAQLLYRLLAKEADEMSTVMTEMGYQVVSLQKVRKALRSFATGRIGDAILILRNAKQDDNNNRYLNFLLSQMLFYRGYQGQAEYLPEAREEAKRACGFDERSPQEKVLAYRYHFAACEMFFSVERGLDVLREYYLLSPETLSSPQGLVAHGGLHLRALFLLSLTPRDLWAQYEIESITTVARQALSGSLLYLYLFRSQAMDAVDHKDPAYAQFIELERNLQETRLKYTEVTQSLSDHFQSGQPKDPPKKFWTVQQRYLNALLTAVTVPRFDDLLLNTSLDGKLHSDTLQFDGLLRERGILNDSYWRIWIGRTSYRHDVHRESTLPDKNVRRDTSILRQYDDLLTELKALEAAALDKDRWEAAKEYMAPLSFEKLLEVGTGRILTSAQRGLDDPYFRPYYQSWGQLPNEMLPSDLIEKRAEAGAFWNLEEIQATFDGAHRAIDDPVIGINQRTRNGYRRFLQAQATVAHADYERRQAMLREHFREFWWFYFVLIPLSLLTFVVVVSSRTIETALRTILILVTLFGAGGYVIYRLAAGGPKTPPAEGPKPAPQAPKADR
jgi:hypothetical protein